MFSVRCSAFDVQRSMFSVRCSAFDVRCSAFNVPLLIPHSHRRHHPRNQRHHHCHRRQPRVHHLQVHPRSIQRRQSPPRQPIKRQNRTARHQRQQEDPGSPDPPARQTPHYFLGKSSIGH